jgi:hypothetical protein
MADAAAPVQGQNPAGPLFNEPMRVETVHPQTPDNWVVGLVGLRSERFRSITLTSADLKALTILEAACAYACDAKLLHPGFQAYYLGIAYEFDPYFGLSILRVDPRNALAGRAPKTLKPEMLIERRARPQGCRVIRRTFHSARLTAGWKASELLPSAINASSAFDRRAA